MIYTLKIDSVDMKNNSSIENIPCIVRKSKIGLLKNLAFITFNIFNKFLVFIIVPTPLVGGGTIYSNWFFLFSQFWPIDIFVVEKCEWYH